MQDLARFGLVIMQNSGIISSKLKITQNLEYRILNLELYNSRFQIPDSRFI